VHPDRPFSHLLAELRDRAAGDVDPAAYWRGVVDALTVLREVAALQDLASTADLIAATDLTAPTRAPGPGPVGDGEGAPGRPAAEVEQAASWLAGYALAATRDHPPDDAAVTMASRLVGGSNAVLDHARQLLTIVEVLDEGHRRRAMQLIARCRGGILDR
jgi:hypothetical protein